MTTTTPRRRRARLGLAAIAMTVAGLGVTASAAGASSSFGNPDRTPLRVVQLDPDVVHIDSLPPVPTLRGDVVKTDFCIRSLGGTLQYLPARLCP